MAEIDTSIYPKPSAPNNPLGMVGDIVGIRNALLQGQQQQQALQIGGQTIRKNEIGINQDQYNLLLQHRAAMVDFFGSLGSVPAAGTKMPDPTDPTGQKTIPSKGLMDDGMIFNAVQRGVTAGLFTMDQALPELHAILAEPTDTGRRIVINQLRGSAVNSQAQLQAYTPAATLQDTGPNIAGVVNPQGGGTPSVPFMINKGLPPTTTTQNPDTSQNYIGAPQPSFQGNIQMPGGGIAGPGAQVSPTGGAAAVPAPGATGSPGTVTAAIPAEAGPYRQAAAGRATALAAANSNVPATKAIIQNMQAEQTGLPPELFGPGSHFTQKAGQLFAEVGGQSQQIGALDAWVKNAQQLANELLPSLGNSSDRTQIAAFASNPNQFLSKNGIARIQALLLGTADANSAKNRAFQTSGSLPGDFNKWESDFNQKFDPRVFQWQYMTKEQKAETVTQLGGKNSPAFKNFARAFNEAAHSGQLPTIQPQGQ